MAKPAEQRALVVECRAIGCTDWIPPDRVFCDRHDAMLQSDVRTILLNHYRPGKRPSKVFQKALARALEEILFAQTAGYKMPREGHFDW